MQDPKIAKKSPSGHHRTTLSGYIFATKARIDNRKKPVKQQCLPNMSLQYGALQRTSGWDLLASLRHPSKFQRVSRLGSVTARHSSIGRQPNFAALNRGRHIYSAGQPSRWALAHISSFIVKTFKEIWVDVSSIFVRLLWGFDSEAYRPFDSLSRSYSFLTFFTITVQRIVRTVTRYTNIQCSTPKQ